MAELTINTADIASALRKNLDDWKPGVETAQVGRVIEVGDGIATVNGLPEASVNELLEFESGDLGLALNLDEDSIGAVVLGEAAAVKEGESVKATGRILSVPVGDGLLGRVVDALGQPVHDGRVPARPHDAHAQTCPVEPIGRSRPGSPLGHSCLPCRDRSAGCIRAHRRALPEGGPCAPAWCAGRRCSRGWARSATARGR